MRESLTIDLADLSDTERLGQALARATLAMGPARCVVYLRGELGAGKTTLVRAWLQGLGFAGRVPSPTYTLVEPYEVAGRTFTHVDLYRIADPQELHYLALDDPPLPAVLWVEWPERGAGVLPLPDLTVDLTVAGESRRAAFLAQTALGRQCLAAIAP